jgi:putative oxidoreductase
MMFNQAIKYTDAPARVAMSAIFLLSGAGKLSAYAQTQGYMEAYGLPGGLLAPTIAFEIGAGLALLVGFQTRFVAFLLAGFSIATALVFHRDFGDQTQMIMFLKNVAITGGFLVMAKAGAPGLSVDALLSARKGR